MKKIGILALVLIFALGSLGVGYAQWSDTVRIEGTVNTGELVVGIRDAGTSDPGTTDDKMFDLVNNIPIQLNTHVGSAESVDGVTKCWHKVNGWVEFYEDVTFTVTNAYPLYYWRDTIEIANCGTIPVKLAKIEYYDYWYHHDWRDLLTTAPSSYKLWSSPLSDDIWLGWYSLDFPHDTVRTGTWYHEFMGDLAAADTQLNPCEVATIHLGFFVHPTNNPEMNATSTMKLRLTFTQWNMVP